MHLRTAPTEDRTSTSKHFSYIVCKVLGGVFGLAFAWFKSYAQRIEERVELFG